MIECAESIAIGDRLVCTEEAGVFRPCQYCGSKTFIVGPGVGKHVAQMRCGGCNRGGRWLGAAYLKEIAP